VSFAQAAQVFLDPMEISIYDEEHSSEEDRWITMGMDKNDILLVVVHTYQEENNATLNIRLISARKAMQRENEQYQKGTWIMEKEQEYDFSKGVRGKFYRPDSRLRLPIYLDDDLVEFIEEFANRKQEDVQTVVNEILRHNKDMLQALR
jgi:uncharacterized DUF497 family protein